MDESEVLENRLLNHACLLFKDRGAKADESLIFQLRSAKQESPPNLELFEDVVSCLIALNTHYNGPDPDTRAPGPRMRPIPEIVSYSIASILADCLRHYQKWAAKQQYSDEVMSTLLSGTHKIAHCWEQLLAGDISDLLEGFSLIA